jgi:hypothetical protein
MTSTDLPRVETRGYVPPPRERGAGSLPLSRGMGGRWERGTEGVRSGGGNSEVPR